MERPTLHDLEHLARYFRYGLRRGLEARPHLDFDDPDIRGDLPDYLLSDARAAYGLGRTMGIDIRGRIGATEEEGATEG